MLNLWLKTSVEDKIWKNHFTLPPLTELRIAMANYINLYTFPPTIWSGKHVLPRKLRVINFPLPRKIRIDCRKRKVEILSKTNRSSTEILLLFLQKKTSAQQKKSFPKLPAFPQTQRLGPCPGPTHTRPRGWRFLTTAQAQRSRTGIDVFLILSLKTNGCSGEKQWPMVNPKISS